jgi:sterol desaturase/sphingolipid hydroxylase (fatty acid hydroxylase superfamily)
MTHIFDKETMLDWINKYGIPMLVAGAFAVLLVSPEVGIVQAILGLSIMYFWVYFFHRALHFLPTEGPFKYINTHWIFHHQPLKILPRWLELCLEFLNDMAMSLIVMVIQKLAGINIVPTSIILFYALWFSSVHIVNYSIIGSQVHRDHHKNVGTNFGPDVIDHMFGTNHEPTREDLIPLSPNIIFAFGITFFLKQCINWID